MAGTTSGGVGGGGGCTASTADRTERNAAAVCAWAVSNVDLLPIMEKGRTTEAALVDVSAILHAMRRGDMKRDAVGTLLATVLADPGHCRRLLLHDPLVSEFVFSSVVSSAASEAAAAKSDTSTSTDDRSNSHGLGNSSIHNHDVAVVPIILPNTLERCLLDFPWRTAFENPELDGASCQVLLQFTYCLCFLNSFPSSPFVCELRDLPLMELLALLRTHMTVAAKDRDHRHHHHHHHGQQLLDDRASGVPGVYALVRELMERHAPDVELDSLYRSEDFLSGRRRGGSEPGQRSRRELVSLLTEAIERCRKSDDSHSSSSSNNNNNNKKTNSTSERDACDGDASGKRAEYAYRLARSYLPSSFVDCVTINALMRTEAHAPSSMQPRYAMLCRDPLLLLRCPLSVWHCRGLRRIMISIFRRLLAAHDQFVLHHHRQTQQQQQQQSPQQQQSQTQQQQQSSQQQQSQAQQQQQHTDEAALELLAARNCVVLRCFLLLCTGPGATATPTATTTGPSSSEARKWTVAYCSSMKSMIRMLVATQRGVVAMLIKQGISDRALDFLVDNVPECIGDAGPLADLLSDHSPLAASEKLSIADGALRIAMAHSGSAGGGLLSPPPLMWNHSYGNENDPDDGAMVAVDVPKQLASAALSTLLSAFFLVVGPVGVPVDTVLGDDSADVTQKCRHATHRMLEALQRLSYSSSSSLLGAAHGRPPGALSSSSLWTECATALQKLAGLCKGEAAMSGVVAGAVASRRKRVLKEIYDGAVKALNSMASPVTI